ncbi:peptidoglycan/LPS O-acetylase OafA/YrhL [Actinoplanes lutulentus]|uniref:acyltransferase family protein n=1 Tax=Actinoplanes lutulentus TaxID=1287878 RepID=UPI0015EB8C8F|nr:acyltransferase [Actinoplanes lutulentus]MBB2944073.1 peptidoglycan/LPS O-acetylase OafA/YrhL [Actinoplanes lutulentus]
MNSPNPPSRTRLATLDGLRISAALMVALYHYTAHETASTPVWGAPRDVAFPGVSDVLKYGWLGVQLFFMISGFVICMSSWGRTPAQFAYSRIMRLFPAYWFAVLLTTTVLYLWPFLWKAPSLDAVLTNLTMLNTPLNVTSIDAVYWTLWSEARFYLLFAVCLLWRGLTLPRVLIFGYGWLVLAMLTWNAKLPVVNVILQPEYAPYFVGGIGLYLVHRFGPGDLRVWGLVGLSFALGAHNASLRAAARHLNPVVCIAAVAVFFVVLGVVALGWTSWIQWRWLTTAGVLTYPFYLIHEYVGWTVMHAVRDFAPHWVVVMVVLTAMLAASWLVHRLVEQPVAGWMKRRLPRAASGSSGSSGHSGLPDSPVSQGSSGSPEVLESPAGPPVAPVRQLTAGPV